MKTAGGTGSGLARAAVAVRGPGHPGRRSAVWGAVALAVGLAAAGAYHRAGATGTDLLRDLSVGWAYAAAGLVAWWRRPANRTGPLLLAEGLTWFLGNFQGSGVPLLFALGAWGEALNLAVLAHLLLAFPEGRLGTRLERRVVACGYGLVAVGGLLRTLLYDPSAGVDASYLACRDCGPNALLLHSDPRLFEAVDLAYRWLGALITLVVLAALVRRWRVSSPARRRILLPAGVAVAIAVAFVGWEVLYVLAPGSLATADALLTLPSDLSQVAVPVAFLAGLLRTRLHRAALGNVVVEVGPDPAPERLQEVLSRVLGDPALRLGLARGGGRDGYADVHGRPLRLPPPGSGLATTPVADGDRRSAVLVHDAALGEDPQLIAAVAASVRLCLRNSTLRSQVTVRAEETRAAQARLLEAADAERRRLERDLHDGAQTRLVFALMSLRRLGRGLDDRADPALRDTVSEADRALRLAIDDLRDLARGIHPAVLTREGLGAAVTALAEEAALPVVVMAEPGRCPPLVESTAYFVVCEALSNAVKHAGAGAVSVSLRSTGGRLAVEVADDGAGGADPGGGTGLRGLADRVAATGGSLEVVSPPGGGTRIRAELPCG
ncbi:ATP-binding protein [Streptomyces sp. Ru87]|uniref:ATP-binding protein n=1 Tax=Streptomyces sp. Ru87 TaxID=2044307 RepID=UPI00211D8A0E|nr:ATP-binding protein [Streptomyces sp. Ru87]